MECNVRHTQCGTVAYVLSTAPYRGEVLRAAMVVWPKGVNDGDRFRCPTCGYFDNSADLEPERWAFDPGDGKVYDAVLSEIPPDA